MTCDTWHVTCDMWHGTCDIWHVTCDTWHMICCRGWTFSKKSRIRETKNLSIDADSRTDTILERLQDLSKKRRKKCLGRGSRLIWNTSPFLGLHARADSVHAKMGAGGGASNLELLPAFRDPREGKLGPHKNADSVNAKKYMKMGQTDRQTDKRTSWL